MTTGSTFLAASDAIKQQQPDGQAIQGMRFHSPLEAAFQAERQAALARSDTGVAALSCCLWLTQLVSFALSRQARTCAKVGAHNAIKHCTWQCVCCPAQLHPAGLTGWGPTTAAATAAAVAPAGQQHLWCTLRPCLAPLPPPCPLPALCLVQAGLLLGANFLPLYEGANWQTCRSRPRCLTILKLCLFALLCWDVNQGGSGSAGGGAGLHALQGHKPRSGDASMGAGGQPAGACGAAPAAGATQQHVSGSLACVEAGTWSVHASLAQGLAATSGGDASLPVGPPPPTSHHPSLSVLFYEVGQVRPSCCSHCRVPLLAATAAAIAAECCRSRCCCLPCPTGLPCPHPPALLPARLPAEQAICPDACRAGFSLQPLAAQCSAADSAGGGGGKPDLVAGCVHPRGAGGARWQGHHAAGGAPADQHALAGAVPHA